MKILSVAVRFTLVLVCLFSQALLGMNGNPAIDPNDPTLPEWYRRLILKTQKGTPAQASRYTHSHKEEAFFSIKNVMSNASAPDEAIVKIINAHLYKHPDDINAFVTADETLLMLAIKYNRKSVALDLAHRENIQIDTAPSNFKKRNYTALFYAISFQKDDTDILDILLTRGADIFHRGGDGRMPICYAVEFHNLQALIAMLRHALQKTNGLDSLIAQRDMLSTKRGNILCRNIFDWINEFCTINERATVDALLKSCGVSQQQLAHPQDPIQRPRQNPSGLSAFDMRLPNIEI